MTPDTLFAAMEATWPAASRSEAGIWTLREGQGGGKRVSAATTTCPAQPGDIDDAETAMRENGQALLFSLRPEQGALDTLLADRGYILVDPSVMYACPVGQLTDQALPRVTVFSIWEPLAIMREIWVQGGIGPARQAVMDRVQGPKAGLLARHRDKPAGVGFVAIHDGVAMVHAVEVLPHQRRQGMGHWLMRGAAFWAEAQGAHTLSVICTQANTAANALYASLGMTPVEQYHYRQYSTEPS